MTRIASLLGVALLVATATAQPSPEKKYEEFDRATKGAKEYDGLFKLYQKDDHVYAEIRPDQFEKSLIAPISIAKGLARGGETLNGDEQWVLAFRKAGERIHLIRRNVRFKSPRREAPVAKAVEVAYIDSVLLALTPRGVNPRTTGILIDLNDIFMSDFAQLGLGGFDASRSSWARVKAFPKNVELQVSATFSGRGGRFNLGNDDAVIDARGTTVVIHYSLVEMPDFAYTPRVADDRVGYFPTALKDYTSDSKDTSFVRYVNRWRLERADGLTNVPADKPVKLSPPKKKIVFWIERSVPDEYRAFVRDGILEWNKAFEKVGFRDAIEVRQQESEDFDPEDMNYATFRWITTDGGFAIGPSRVNPLTGEILDADILFDADMVRFWKAEAKTFGQGSAADGPVSMIQDARDGRHLLRAMGWNDRPLKELAELPAVERDQFAARLRQGLCQCGACMKYELGLAGLALAGRGLLKPGEKLPEELVGQAIKSVVMHEVGHTLGLRHNYKASTMLPNDKLHDKSITREKGLSASVMDYLPVNLAPKGQTQGDYFTTTLGAYDYWAIDYGYRPRSGGTEGESDELLKSASKSASHDYGTDEDLMTPDPLINQWDLGAEPLRFAQDRMKLAEEMLPGLADRVVEKGEGYQRARLAFALLLRQYGDGAAVVSSYVGGANVHRDHKGDADARDPYVPVKAAKQREALKFLQDNVFTDKPFQFPPETLRRLAAERWWHWGTNPAGVEINVLDRVLNIQRLALGNVLDARTLNRIQNNALKAAKDDQPLTLAEVFRSLTDSIWTDPAKTSLLKRNLQREYVKHLSQMVLGQSSGGGRSVFFILFGGGGAGTPPDARSLARYHLRELVKKIDTALADKSLADEQARAHLDECKEQIGKVLAAALQMGE